MSKLLLISQATCFSGGQLLGVAKEQVGKRAQDDLKTKLEGKLESFGEALNPGFSTLNQGDDMTPSSLSPR